MFSKLGNKCEVGGGEQTLCIQDLLNVVLSGYGSAIHEFRVFMSHVSYVYESCLLYISHLLRVEKRAKTFFDACLWPRHSSISGISPV